MLYPHLYPGQLAAHGGDERGGGAAAAAAAAAQYRAAGEQHYSAEWVHQQQQQAMGADGLDARYRAGAGDPSVWRPYSWPSEHRQ